jgi:putative aminopeptidase FrvX
MRDDLRDILDALLRAPAPSGYETPAAEVWRAAAEPFAEVRGDVMGNSFATVNPGGAPHVAIVGHIDEIGFVVKSLDETGMLWLDPIGSWDPTVLPGQRVIVATRSGQIPGVVGRRAAHLLDESEKARAPKVAELWVDIGARDRADAAGMVRIGDPVVLDARPQPLANGRMSSRALDNRLGALVALEAARLVHEAGDAAARVTAVAAVQEEITYGGGYTAGYGLAPDVAIVLDVTHTTDYPDIEVDLARRVGDYALGGGPVISRGATVHRLVAERLIELAEGDGRPHAVAADGSQTWTDTDAVSFTRAGVATGLVSIPLRYMHSPSETVQLSDVVETAELVARFCRSLRPDEDWTR